MTTSPLSRQEGRREVYRLPFFIFPILPPFFLVAFFFFLMATHLPSLMRSLRPWIAAGRAARGEPQRNRRFPQAPVNSGVGPCAIVVAVRCPSAIVMTIESEMPCLYNIETIDCQENQD